MNVDIEHRKFVEAGYECIPLKPLSKRPLVYAWQTKPALTQWWNIKGDTNIGLRAGNGKAFIDCDDKVIPGTSENVFNWMAGLGYDRGSYPVVRTASGIGHHIYVNFTGALGNNKRNLISSMGAGDFRYNQGAYVVAFPSVIADGSRYTLVEGDITLLPTLDVKDIATLINLDLMVEDEGEENEELIENQKAPINNKRPLKKMSPLAKAICAGETLDKYTSASEAEGALVLSLINSGYDYDGIRNVFDHNPCQGHYTKKHADHSRKEGERWFYMTYKEMLAFSRRESPTRRKIITWQKLAHSAPWGRVTDKNIFNVFLKTAHKAGRVKFDLAIRDIALDAHVGIGAVSNGIKRIAKTKMISVKEIGKGNMATTFELNEDKVVHTLSSLNERMCSNLSKHDAFRNGGGKYAKGRLGQRAGDIYELLLTEELTIDEIQERTGTKCHKTVKRTLKKMERVIDYKTGEIIQMVICEDGRWKSKIVNLDLISIIVGTHGATDKQEMQYDFERRERRTWRSEQ